MASNPEKGGRGGEQGGEGNREGRGTGRGGEQGGEGNRERRERVNEKRSEINGNVRIHFIKGGKRKRE